MNDLFFERPVLNSPYEKPGRHWELDGDGQPTQKIVETRRPADFITPIPKPRKRKGRSEQQAALVFDEEAKKLGTEDQQYDLKAIINGVRRQVDQWRALPDSSQWGVTPETARLLRHWRSHRFSSIRPFFCQIEAVETVIWLTEVARGKGQQANNSSTIWGMPIAPPIRNCPGWLSNWRPGQEKRWSWRC